MPIDPSIVLGVKPIQVESPVNQLAKVLQIQGMQDESQMNRLKTAEYQRTTGETNKLNDLYRTSVGADGTVDRNALYTGAAQQGLGSRIPGLQKGFLETDKAQAEVDKEKLAMAKQRTELTGQAAGWLRQNPTPENASAMIDHLTQNQVIPPQMAAQMKQQLAANPGSVPQLADMMFRTSLATKDQLLKFEKVDTGGGIQVGGADPLTGKFTPTATLAKTADPNAVLQAQTSRANNRDTVAGENLRAGINPDGSGVDSGGLLSPESVANAAARYNMDGTLPPNLGRGTQGPRQTAQILNEAARMAAAKGDTPEAQRIAQLANKSSAQALTKLETTQNMVGAFEKNFTKNADIAQELSNKVDRTGVPLVNKWVNAGKRAVTGDPDLAAFDASVKATVNEYAKIVGGGTGSSATAQGEIAKIEGLLSAAQTSQQVTSVLNLMRRETANRMTAFEDQKRELKAGMVGAKPAGAAAGSTAPAASGTAPAGWSYLGTTK